MPGPEVRHVALSHNGKDLVIALGEGNDDKWTLPVWSTETRKPQKAVPQQSPCEVVVFSPDDKLLASGDRKGAVRLWQWPSRREVKGPPNHTESIQSIAFSRDSKLLATASMDLTVQLWDMVGDKPHGKAPQVPSRVRTLAFSPNGKFLATGSIDGTARLWDVATGVQIGPAMRHDQFVNAVAFHPDGKLLATGSFDGSLRLWPVPALVSDLHEMGLRTWVSLGLELNAQGAVQAIPCERWRQLREELRALKARH